MIYEVRLIPTAEETYDALIEQLSDRWGESKVDDLNEKIAKCIEIIKTNPYFYPVANETTGIRKCVLHKNCSMYYQVRDSLVLVSWFGDNRQDPFFI